MADGDNAMSGGLLVILGILVALGAVLFFWQYKGGGSVDKPDIAIELPEVK